MAGPFELEIQPTSLTLAPNVPPAQVMITVHNRSAVVDQFRLVVEGPEDGWCTVPEAAKALFPGTRETVRCTIQPPETTRAGEYICRVIVTSTADPLARSEAQIVVRVPANYQFELDMTPKKVIGRKGRYTLSVRNTGNADLALEWQAVDDEDRCIYRFQPEEVRLEPGRRQSVVLTVRPQRSGFVGQRVEYGFQVTAKPSQGQPKTIQGRIVHTPRLRTWRPVWRLFKFAVVVAAVAIFVAYQGGVSGIQRQAPHWQSSLTHATCERMQLFCPAPTPPKGVGRP